jgi:hypothetical protein
MHEKIFSIVQRKNKKTGTGIRRVSSESFSKTSVRFRSDGMVTLPELVKNIPWSKAKNQMKLARGRSVYHKEPLPCDLSVEISSTQQYKIIAD